MSTGSKHDQWKCPSPPSEVGTAFSSQRKTGYLVNLPYRYNLLRQNSFGVSWLTGIIYLILSLQKNCRLDHMQERYRGGGPESQFRKAYEFVISQKRSTQFQNPFVIHNHHVSSHVSNTPGKPKRFWQDLTIVTYDFYKRKIQSQISRKDYGEFVSQIAVKKYILKQ